MKHAGSRGAPPLSLLLLVASLAGCSGIYSVRAGELAPAQASVAPDTRVAVWQRAIPILIDQGYVPQLLNESATYISARRRDDLLDDALSGTTALVTISTEGLVRIALTGHGTFGSEADFVRAMTERQNLLLKLITSPPGSPPIPRQP